MGMKVGRVLPRVRRSGSLTSQNYGSNLQMCVSEATYLWCPHVIILEGALSCLSVYRYLSNTHTSQESIYLEMECAALSVNA